MKRNGGALFGNAWGVYQKARPPIASVPERTWKHMKMMQDAFVACGWGAMDEPLGVVKNIDLEYSQAKNTSLSHMDGNKRLS